LTGCFSFVDPAVRARREKHDHEQDGPHRLRNAGSDDTIEKC